MMNDSFFRVLSFDCLLPPPIVYLSGRRLTSQGTRDLDRIAGQVRIINLIFVLIVNPNLGNVQIFL